VVGTGRGGRCSHESSPCFSRTVADSIVRSPS
jgi:hypothetical protein